MSFEEPVPGKSSVLLVPGADSVQNRHSHHSSCELIRDLFTVPSSSHVFVYFESLAVTHPKTGLLLPRPTANDGVWMNTYYKICFDVLHIFNQRHMGNLFWTMNLNSVGIDIVSFKEGRFTQK